mgnify:CR=1 FL=1
MPKSDYIIVDEIQDFTEQEIREFIQAARKNFYFFGDTAQSIFESLKDTISVEDIQFNIEAPAKATSAAATSGASSCSTSSAPWNSPKPCRRKSSTFSPT